MSIFSRNPGTAIMLAPPEPNLAAIPEQVSHQGLSLPQIFAILLAYWMQIAAITIVFTFLGYVVIKLLPKTYTANATLIVNSDVKDPLATRDFPTQTIVSTQMELLTSPVVLVPVIRQLNLMRDKEFGGSTVDSPAVQANVQKKLAAAIRVERGTGGQLLYVYAASKSAPKAAAIANAVADVYIEQDRRRLNDPAAQRAQRYTEELAELRDKASAAQAKVAEFAKANGIDDLSSAGAEGQTLESLRQKLIDTQNLTRSLEAKQIPDQIADSSGPIASQALLDTQQSQLAELRSTYGPQHPKVKELTAQIAITQHILGNQKQSLAAKMQATLNQNRQLEQNYLRAIAEQEVKVAKIRQAQAEGNKLLLELESAKAVYKQALDGFDQIMFQAVANHTNVSVVSPAVAPLAPSKPNKMKLMLAALAASIGLGVAIPFAFGLFVARRLRCRDDMERDFGIAVLAQLRAVPALARAT